MTVRPPARREKANLPATGKFAFLRHVTATCGLSGLLITQASGQRAPDERRVIVVTGQRANPPARPERTVDNADLSTYGVSSVGELIDEIAGEEGENPADIAILVDGRLVGGRSSIDDYPAESVERIEVLAPGAAGRRGGSITARAVNVVLRPKSRVVAARGSVRAATDGGWTAGMGELGLTAIDRPRRINLTTRVTREGALLESERRIDQQPGALAGTGRSRSLRGERDRVDVTLAASDQLTSWLNASLNINMTHGENDARLGFLPTGDQIVQRGRSNSAGAELQLEADHGDWLFTMDSAFREDRQRTAIDAPSLATVGARTRSTSRDSSVELRANGPIFRLPAGQMRVTVGGAWSRTSIDGRFDSLPNSFDQTNREARLGLDIPVASRANDFASSLGEVAIGAEFRRGRVSDLGATSSDSLTLRWEPRPWLRLFGAVSSSRTPPSADLLAATPVETPGIRYFDPVRGETVDVVTTSGGNAALKKFRIDSRQLSIRLQPFRKLDLVLNGEYSSSETRNVIAVLPPASDTVIAAFPDRFIRDPDGRLIAVDLRPVSFDRQSQSQLRHGLNLTVPLNRADREKRGRRVQLTASHTMLLSSKLTIGDGGPTIDLLSRRAAGFGGVTQPRHQFDLALAYAERGLGVRLSAERRSASYLDIGQEASGDLLTFEPLTTFGIRAFAEASRLFPRVDWLKGGRFTLTAVNVTNDRELVRDRTGLTPLNYQRAYRDPLGRTVELEFRKTF